MEIETNDGTVIIKTNNKPRHIIEGWELMRMNGQSLITSTGIR